VYQSVSHCNNQSVGVSISQSVSDSMYQSVSQSVTLCVNQSVSVSISPSVHQWVSQCINQSVSQSVYVSVRQPVRPHGVSKSMLPTASGSGAYISHSCTRKYKIQNFKRTYSTSRLFSSLNCSSPFSVWNDSKNGISFALFLKRMSDISDGFLGFATKTLKTWKALHEKTDFYGINWSVCSGRVGSGSPLLQASLIK
jgi:hypothetical protein